MKDVDYGRKKDERVMRMRKGSRRSRKGMMRERGGGMYREFYP